MIEKRDELEKKIDSFILKYNSSKRAFSILQEKLEKHDIFAGEVQAIWSKNKPLDLVDDATLYLLTKYISEYLNEIEELPLKIDKYFTPVQINDGNNYKKEIFNEKITFPIIIEGVEMGSGDRCLFYLPMKTIKLWQDNGIYKYNFDTQRSPKYKSNGDDELIKIPNYNKDSIEEISEGILSGDFIPNTITFNLLQNGQDSFEYKKNQRRLIIYSGEINPIDGFHRCLGIVKALGKNPNIEQNMEIRFTNWDVQKCRNFIYQEDKRNEIDKTYMQSIININKWGNKVVSKLNEGSGDLKNKITTDQSLIKNNKVFTMFNFMSDAIDLLWDFKTNMDVNELSEYLSTFFDFVIGYKVEDFIEDVNKSRQNNIITFPATFIGYLSIAKKLQNDSDWKNKLKYFFENTDFSIENPEWNKLKIVSDSFKPVLSLNKPNFKNIISYFDNLIG